MVITYFPQDFPWEKFVKVKSMDGTVDEKNIYPHTFEIYQKIEDEGWRLGNEILAEEMEKDYYQELQAFVQKRRAEVRVFPEEKNVF